jgi:fructose-bisphosphate aldolase, class II
MLVHIKELFKGNVVGQFAYPAFNTMDLEITRGILDAAEELNTPVILEASEGAIKYAGLLTIYEIMATLAVHAKVPVALHMDHGKDMDQLKEGIGLGFSSVMIDHSHLPYDQNAKDTKEMVEFAHAEGAWVQGEIGRIRGSEDWVSVSDEEALLTDPMEALKFYQDTGVDTLACSFGTVHGVAKMNGKAQAHVDIARIKAVHDLVKIPLVLHGASGVPAETITEAIAAGIAVINIDTELRMAYTKALRQSLAGDLTEIDPRKIMKPVIEGVKAAAELKLKEFKTQNLVV